VCGSCLGVVDASALRTDRSPFKQRVKDEAVTTWVKPKLVAEVKFTEWTAAGEMRHPSFLGLREDERPKDVVREKEAAQHLAEPLALGPVLAPPPRDCRKDRPRTRAPIGFEGRFRGSIERSPLNHEAQSDPCKASPNRCGRHNRG
jgi:hypothetical protein